MGKKADKLIGYCGYNCYLCAARSDDLEVRQKMVDTWRKYLGHKNYYSRKCLLCWLQE
jgi:hypothetical protein